MRGEGRCLFSSSQRRNPPRNALALSPARQPLGSITSPKDHIVRFESANQARHDVSDVAPPFLFSSLPQAPLSYVILIGPPFVREAGQFHRLNDTIAIELPRCAACSASAPAGTGRGGSGRCRSERRPTARLRRRPPRSTAGLSSSPSEASRSWKQSHP
jgi:hypothetical protein